MGVPLDALGIAHLAQRRSTQSGRFVCGKVRTVAIGLAWLIAMAIPAAGCSNASSSSKHGSVGTTAATVGTTAATTTSGPTDPGGVIDPAYRGEGPTVAVLGDSLTYISRDELRADLAQYSLRIAAWLGEGFDGGPFSDTFGDERLMLDLAPKFATDAPDVLVLALGTNDAWNPSRSLPDALAVMQRIVSTFPDSCLVGVTIPQDLTIPDYDNQRGRAINSAMRGWADVVADWRPTPQMLAPDGVHPTGAGIPARAKLVGDAVRRCRR